MDRVEGVDRTGESQLTRRSLMTVALGVGAVTVAGCATRTDTTQEQASVPPRSSPEASSAAPSPTAPVLSREEVVAEYGSRAPNSWGIDVPGVAMSLPEGTEPVALTFDCCGGPGGDTLDEALVKALRGSGTAATFFLAGRWVEANPALTEELAADPLFEIANHGTAHQPLSVSGASAYGIAGTTDAGAVYDEIMGARKLIEERTGTTPTFFRSGTAHLDDVSAEIARSLGLLVVNFNRNGDDGGTLPAPSVSDRLVGMEPGDILLAHSNRPSSGTAAGVTAALPVLRERGMSFARLSDALPTEAEQD